MRSSVLSYELRKTLEIDVGPSQCSTVNGSLLPSTIQPKTRGNWGLGAGRSRNNMKSCFGLWKSEQGRQVGAVGWSSRPCSAASIGVPGSLHERGVPRRPCDSA
jgi:hypothetical protein